MDNILFINACPRIGSRTLELANYLMTKIEGKIEEINLFEKKLEPLNNKTLEIRDSYVKNNNYSDDMFNHAKQFAKADVIVVAAPYWDLLFPAVLRIYLENISVSGITFYYSHDGRPIGLCKAKKVYYVTTAGGFIGNNNYGYEYINSLFRNLYGIKDIELISAEGLDVFVDKTSEVIDKTKNMIDLKFI